MAKAELTTEDTAQATAPVTAPREFAGYTVNVPQPYTEGSVLTANEAKFINAQLGSVVGNQFGGFVRRGTETAKEKGETFTIDAQAKFDEIFSGYKIGESNRGEGGTPTDPVEARAHSIAVGVVKSALKTKGYKLFSARTPNGVKAEKVNELAAQYLTANPHVKDVAKAQIDAEANLSVDLGSAVEASEPATEA